MCAADNFRRESWLQDHQQLNAAPPAQHLRDCTRPTLDPVISLLNLLFPLLKVRCHDSKMLVGALAVVPHQVPCRALTAPAPTPAGCGRPAPCIPAACGRAALLCAQLGAHLVRLCSAACLLAQTSRAACRARCVPDLPVRRQMPGTPMMQQTCSPQHGSWTCFCPPAH